jgi:hypothetical protein
MPVALEETSQFTKRFKQLPAVAQQDFRNQMARVAIDPESAGRYLSVLGLYELRHRVYRAYYFLDKTRGIARFHAVGHKQYQDKIIEALRKLSEMYRRQNEK